jgi:hypothetical protein
MYYNEKTTKHISKLSQFTKKQSVHRSIPFSDQSRILCTKILRIMRT